MTNSEKISEDIIQHKKDAENVLKDLGTMKCNIWGSKINWTEIVETRKKHIGVFIKSLKKQEQEFEHFK